MVQSATKSAIHHSPLVIQGGSGRVTYMIAQDLIPKNLFEHNGTLDDQPASVSYTLNSIGNTSSPIAFALSHDLGAIQATLDPIVWAIGYITDPVINYTDPSGVSQQRSLYYKTQYLDDDDSLVGIHFHS